MNKIIINADDCVYSMEINCAIKETIEAGKISSTTVMANMSDFDGSIKLFDEYKKHISFGVHLNLTEGRPLTKSKVLFDAGIMTESEDGVMSTGKDIRYTKLNENLKKAIYEELNQQVHKVYDNIRVSHIDSHHHNPYRNVVDSYRDRNSKGIQYQKNKTSKKLYAIILK